VEGNGALPVEPRSLPCPSFLVYEDDIPERPFENGHHVGDLRPMKERPACAPPPVKGAMLVGRPVETRVGQWHTGQLLLHNCLFYQFMETFRNGVEWSGINSREEDSPTFFALRGRFKLLL